MGSGYTLGPHKSHILHVERCFFLRTFTASQGLLLMIPEHAAPARIEGSMGGGAEIDGVEWFAGAFGDFGC